MSSKTCDQSVSKLPFVSIIISNYNGEQYLPECLSSLMNLEYPNYEVIVEDAASTDNSRELIKRCFPKVRLEEQKKIGIGEAINHGISISKGEFIVFDLNTDDIVAKNWLRILVNALSSSPDIGIVCGKRFRFNSNRILDSVGGHINFLTGDTPGIGQNRQDSDEYNIEKEVDYVGVILTRVDVLKKVGLVDPEYYIYYEDTDFCLRAKMAGYKVVCVPSAILWHRGSATVGKTSYKSYYLLSRNQIRFILKNYPFPFIFSALIYTLILKTFLESLIVLPPISKLTMRLIPQLRVYLKNRNGITLINAKKAAMLWNAKNLRRTIQGRYQNEKLKAVT